LLLWSDMTGLKEIYGLDIRSINMFRVVLGGTLICQVIGYVLMNFGTMFSPETGALGNGFAADYIAAYTGPEWLFKIDSDFGMLVFIGIRLLFLILFTVGFFPRLAALVSAILLWLFQVRYNVLFLGWEMFAAVLISFSVFFPWNRKPEGRFEWRSPLAFVTLFQIGFIYFYNGISKNGHKWLDGTAVKFFLAEFDKSRPLAFQVIELDWLTSFMTYSTLIVEVGILILLFFPFKNSLLRYVVVFLILTLHWGIDLFVNVGFFKWYAVCMAVLLLPGSFWNRLSSPIQNLIKRAGPFRTLAMPSGKLAKYTESVVAISLVYMIVLTNLNQTVSSKTNDRVGRFLKESKLSIPVRKLTPNWWPQYSFMRQFWHLYSPDPPSEKGYMQFEIITQVDTFRVSNGHNLSEGQLYSSAPERHLMQYLTLRQGRNQRDKIAQRSKLMYEIRKWNANPMSPRIISVEIVLYSFRPDRPSHISKSPPVFERIVKQVIDIDYRGT